MLRRAPIVSIFAVLSNRECSKYTGTTSCSAFRAAIPNEGFDFTSCPRRCAARRPVQMTTCGPKRFGFRLYRPPISESGHRPVLRRREGTRPKPIIAFLDAEESGADGCVCCDLTIFACGNASAGFGAVMSDAPKSTVGVVSLHGRLLWRSVLGLVSTTLGVGVARFTCMELSFWGLLQSVGCVTHKDPHDHCNAEPNCKDCHGVPLRTGCEFLSSRFLNIPPSQIYNMIVRCQTMLEWR